MRQIPTVRAFIAGISGAGKSTRAWDLYLRHFPRSILFDQTGEWHANADRVAHSVRDGVEAIRAFAGRGRWTVVISSGPDELPALTRWLIPTPDISRSPVLMLGGCALLIDEADLVAPPGTATEHIRTLARRSRHAGLSVIWTTQRPENVSREVTAQCQHLIALSLMEPRAIDYMRRAMNWSREDVAYWLRWCRVHPHGGCWKDTRSGESKLIPEAGPLSPWRTTADQWRDQTTLALPPSSSRHSAPGREPDGPPTVSGSASASGLQMSVPMLPISEDGPDAGEREPEPERVRRRRAR